jgi:hypothetical protein
MKDCNDNLFVFATKDDELAKKVIELINNGESEVIRLDSRLIDDFNRSRNHEDNKASETVDEFINKKENRDKAETKALALWNLLTNNDDLVKSSQRIFTSSEITKRTNMTNKKLKEALELFHLFGLVEYIKGNYMFKFVFSDEIKRTNVYADIIQDVTNINTDISRYKNMFDDKEAIVNELKDNLLSLIIF